MIQHGTVYDQDTRIKNAPQQPTNKKARKHRISKSRDFVECGTLPSPETSQCGETNRSSPSPLLPAELASGSSNDYATTLGLTSFTPTGPASSKDHELRKREQQLEPFARAPRRLL